ncbi:MAG: leucine-rich repeat domain-containing protein, partial [Prevotella sp.]|nr:leucine-rich repeat domain-containing protein [Prevotella sp.]
IPKYAFANCTNIPEVNIDSKITDINDYAFYNCDSLVNATIENHGSIGAYAFYSCGSLVNATIKNKGDIGSYAFAYCSRLSSINLRNKGTVGSNAFCDCYKAESLTIAPTVTSIGNKVFSYCNKIGDVTIEDRDTELKLGSNGTKPMFSDCRLDEVYIGGKIVYETGSSSGYSPFYRNTSLRKVTITDKETTIYDNEFYGCTGLKEVSIGDGVTSFGRYAFSGCSALEAFEFGAHVKTIGEEAFSDCTAMTKMISHNPIPPVCGTEALDDINKWECTLYVPDAAIDTYKAADQWKNFFFVENYTPAGIDSATATDKEKTEVARYDMGGNRVTESYNGVVIIRYADGTRAKVLSTGR